MNEQKQKVPRYIEALAWIVIHAPHYALFYLIMRTIEWLVC